LTIPRPPISTLFPYTTLFRSRPPLGGLGKPQDFLRNLPGRSARNTDDADAASPRRCGNRGDRVAKIHGLPARTAPVVAPPTARRSEEHTSELQSLAYLVCRLL